MLKLRRESLSPSTATVASNKLSENVGMVRKKKMLAFDEGACSGKGINHANDDSRNADENRTLPHLITLHINGET